MNKDYTHITMIIDRSGSMSSCWKDVEGGYTEIVKTNKAEPGKCTFSVAVFDNTCELLEDFTDIQKVKEELSVKPRGGTALLDAIGKTIVTVGENLAKLDETDRPMKVLVVIQTDGEENCSNEFNKEQIKKLIDEHTNTYKWEFQFIGASLQSVKDASSWGIKNQNTSMYSTQNSSATLGVLGEKMRSMRSAPDMATYACAATFTDEEKSVLNKESN